MPALSLLLVDSNLPEARLRRWRDFAAGIGLPLGVVIAVSAGQGWCALACEPEPHELALPIAMNTGPKAAALTGDGSSLKRAHGEWPAELLMPASD